MQTRRQDTRNPRRARVQRRNFLFQSVPVAPISLFKPSSGRVTFEIISPRRSRPTPDRSDSSRTTPTALSWPSTYPTCQILDIPAVQDSPRTEQTCPDQQSHDLGSLLIRRAQNRQDRAWTRKRHAQFDSRRSVTKRNRLGIRLQCLVCGLLFIGLLATYLTLVFNVQLSTAVSVLLVLLALVSGILFVHGLFRAWLLRRNMLQQKSHRRPRLHRSGHSQSSRHHHHHRRGRRSYRYTDPESPFDVLPCDDSLYTPTTPVRVHLLRDEEAELEEKSPVVTVTSLDREAPTSATNDSPLPTPPPPAYGLWRCSVRADPNLLHWQRSPESGNGQVTPVQESYFTNGPATNTSSCRPPSYANTHESLPEMVQEVRSSPLIQVETPTYEDTEDAYFVAGSDEDSVVQDDWPLRRVSGAVQEVTRMLLAESFQHQAA